MDPAEGRRILVAVDEGDESVQALRWCLANFATRGDGELAPPDTILLLYVRPTPPTYSVLDASAPLGYLFANEATAAIDGYSRAVADAVVDKAQKLCALHNKENGEVKVKVDVKVAVGDARSVICDMVDKLGADVLVMGSHGYGFFKRALLGSVSDYCVSNANCPVLIVKSK
ncbi:universal stress protein PHOS32 isoform X1 [Hordeum vulgare subsp. vulgare]|uniref:Universal stress protein 1561 n=2 Tax=Hordeum vulgare subsp. vulgare TaxID=112509 RepID=D2XV77_HORVV|nr:universal stress protein PHOS32 isoform X1 [Hordeum vulgare subsp. vulgare]ADB54811.1 universal stress protein 1561 [Hordeum vulgare subsp. vulgare]ADB54818.1 universal stress protein 1561 [Hordeum vulgare subsp. vulgare]